MGLLVHGIADAAVSDDLEESSELTADVSLVTAANLVAVVRTFEGEDVVPSRSNLLAHARLLEHLGTRATVIPMRFGVVVDDAPRLRATLEARKDWLRSELNRLDGTHEWRLRGRYDEEHVIREVLASDRRAARLHGAEGFEQRLELGERIARAIEARRQHDVTKVAHALEPHVRDLRPEVDAAAPLDAFTVAVLVAASEAEGFDAAVDGFGAQVGPTLQLELIGPLPPFSFVAAEAGAWD